MRDDDVEDRQNETCCAGDGGWPSGLADQAESPNHRKLRRSRAGVVSVAAKGPLSAGQVCDEKTNVSKPLRTHRKNRTTASKPRGFRVLGKRAALLGPLEARGLPVCCSGGARCIGGVSSSQALVWNRRTCRLDTVGQLKWVKLAPWLREGGPQAAETARGRVPMRGTGAGRSVRAMKAL